MPAFLAPLFGAAGGVALGYILDHTLGDSDYSGKEMFVDATTGAVGGGLVGPMMRVGSRANTAIRHTGSQGYKVGAGVTESLLVAGYVTKPMISRPARMELLAGTVASLVYDIAYSKSPDVSSERNATDVTSGGTLPTLEKQILDKWSYKGGPRPFKQPTGKYPNFRCAKGYKLMQYNGKALCVRRDIVP
jgi:hypothetical protein